jgi:hypothetical protein
MRERGLVALGWITALIVAAAVLALAACGGTATTAPPTSTNGASPSPGATLTPDQRALLGQFPDLKHEGQALGTLRSQKELSADEIRAAITSDPRFVEAEALGAKAGFGSANGGVELQYDNGATITVALLTSSDDGVGLVAREAGAMPAYALVHLAADGRHLTMYRRDLTITLDLETAEGSAVDTPEAEHSCRAGHCIYAAVVYLFQSWGFGTALKAVCGACIDSVALLPATAGVSSVVAIPSCIGCIPMLASMGIAATVDCEIDPCDYCADDSCEESETYELCSDFSAPADSVTGSRAGVDQIRNGYHCVGVETSTFPIPKVDYSATQCTYASELVGLVQACPYGCASPAPGDTVRRTCNTTPGSPLPSPSPPPTPTPSPTPQCKKNSDCPVGPRRDIACGPMSGGGWLVIQEYTAYYCSGGQCLPDLRREGVPCPGGCAPDGISCAGSATPSPTLTATPVPTATPAPTAQPSAQVTARLWEQVSPDAFAACAGCQVRLTGIGGTYTATSDASGAVTLHSVHYGSYAVEQLCRERQEGRWVNVWTPALNPVTLAVPAQGTVNIELAKCPRPTAK